MLNSDQRESSSSNSNYDRQVVYVPNTPFNLTRMKKGDKWKIAVGNKIASAKQFRTKWVAKLYIKSKPLMLITAASLIMYRTSKIISEND